MADSRRIRTARGGSIDGVPLDTDRAYRAVTARDTRFDGCFVTAVRTTGIYCRPSCPALAPKRHNVEFFPTAAAAQQRGYRACRRCLPDAVPGSPDWDTRADLAARAMRLITDGVVEREGVPGLAARLGYSPRHLSRVLTAELGAGPLALARAHRAQAARLLVESTTLGMADVAFAAGFASVRQFNDTVRAVYGVAPTVLRGEARRRRQPATTPGTIALRLPFRPPLDAAGLLAFLAARAVPGVEHATAQCYARTVRLPHGPATVALRPDAGHVHAVLRLTDLRDLATAVCRTRRLLDLDADPAAVDEALGADPALAETVRATPGIRIPGSTDTAEGTETLLRAVLGQQVSVAAARTAVTRLVAALGERLPSPDGPLTHLFPTAEAVAEHGGEVLTGPRRRAEAVLGLARGVAAGELTVHIGLSGDDLASRLTALPGLGPWTARYVTLRLLRAPDELLATDGALRRGAAALGLPATPDALARHGRRWRPWRSYAGMHLWRAAATVTTDLQRRTA